MMDFISVPLVVGIVCAGIYGLFELFVRKRERLAIIEKIGDKLDASAFDGKLVLPHYMRNFSFSSLKAGCLLVGIGLFRGSRCVPRTRSSLSRRSRSCHAVAFRGKWCSKMRLYHPAYGLCGWLPQYVR